MFMSPLGNDPLASLTGPLGRCLCKANKKSHDSNGSSSCCILKRGGRWERGRRPVGPRRSPNLSHLYPATSRQHIAQVALPSIMRYREVPTGLGNSTGNQACGTDGPQRGPHHAKPLETT